MQSRTIFIGAMIFFHQMALIQTQNMDIVQTAMSNTNFSTLVTAIGAAGLTMTLKSTGPFTVFAPTNAAFSKLPVGTLANLLKPENMGQLVQILEYHVINGQNLTSAAINAMSLPVQVTMLAGGTVTVSRNGTSLKVNDATVVIPDIMATNGIIHAIDTVLMPQATGSATYVHLNKPFFSILACTILFSFLHFS